MCGPAGGADDAPEGTRGEVPEVGQDQISLGQHPIRFSFPSDSCGTQVDIVMGPQFANQITGLLDQADSAQVCATEHIQVGSIWMW